MSQSENVRRVAEQILEAFQAGTVPAACAQIFLRHTPDDSRLSARWSWRNQLLAALLGHHDARGFRQWQEVGRHVRKGERAFYILAPSLRRAEPKDDEPQDEPEFVVAGFLCVPVFGYSQTEGDPLPGAEEEAAFLSALPLVEVARSWGLHVGTFAAEGTSCSAWWSASVMSGQWRSTRLRSFTGQEECPVTDRHTGSDRRKPKLFEEPMNRVERFLDILD